MKSAPAFLLASFLISLHLACAAQQANVPRFLSDREAHDAGYKNVAASPRSDLAPVVFVEKGGSVPSCGIIQATRQTNTQEYIELVGADAGEDFPQCLNIRAMAEFKLQGRNYVGIVYVSRETREDVARNFSYVYDSGVYGFTLDESLTEVRPDEGRDSSVANNRAMAIKLARTAVLKKKFSQWQLQERDFISDKASSFAIFDDTKSKQCHVVAEAGGAAIATSLTDYFPNVRCAAVLASTRFEKAGTNYYLAMFKADGGKQLVTVTSVSADGRIATEKGLSDTINKSGATRDIKSAKAALAGALP